MATFINQYNQSSGSADPKFNYSYSKEFVENDTSFVYAVGEIGKGGCITKIGRNGKEVWNKRVSNIVNSTDDIKVTDIIQLVVDDVNLTLRYIVIVKHLSRVFMLCFNPDGSHNWIKELDWIDQIGNIFIKESKKDSSYYVALSDSKNNGKHTKFSIINFDSNGEVISCINETSWTDSIITTNTHLYISAIDTNQNGLLVAFVLNKEPSLYSVIELFSLDLNDSVRYSLPINYIINDVKNKTDKTYLISGSCIKHKSFFAEIYFDVKDNESVRFYPLNAPAYNLSKLCLRLNGFYFLEYDGTDSVIHLFNSKLETKWTKKIEILPNVGNGIKDINFINNRLTLTFLNNNLKYTVINSNSNLSTCKTTSLIKVQLDRDEFALKVSTKRYEQDRFRTNDELVSYYNEGIRIIKICKTGITLFPSILQSPHFAVLASGSSGTTDGSAKGIHLRWTFAGKLAASHLPKGDYFEGQEFAFNKADDFVRIFRAPYNSGTKKSKIINFSTSPTVVDNVNCFWVYVLNNPDGTEDKVIYIYFKNKNLYNSIIQQNIDPLSTPLEFITQYGNNVIEVESKKDLFFGSRLILVDYVNNPVIRTEILSVKENLLITPKYTYIRDTQVYSSINTETKQYFSDNGKVIRFRPTNCVVSSIELEFYIDYLKNVNELDLWDNIGEYALSQEEDEVFTALEPIPNIIHGKWPRFNDGDKVNIENYIDKWQRPIVDEDKNLKMVVDEFLTLSTDITNPNPSAIVTIDFGGTPNEDDPTEGQLSLLDVLNFSATDYHIARMLGLGTIDTDVAGDTTENFYIYVGEYTSKGYLISDEEVTVDRHLSVTLPTSFSTERLPIPYAIDSIEPGIVTGNNNPNPEIESIDENGYTSDGKLRYVTIIAKSLPYDEIDKDFYWSNEPFDSSKITLPIFAGLEYKSNTMSSWIRPELSHDLFYKNLFQGAEGSFESIPISVNEDSNVMYIHKHRESGIHYYNSYGINLFSRVSGLAPVDSSIVTTLTPTNNLKPPVNVNALLIRKENPLYFTSETEQLKLKELYDLEDEPGEHIDKTLVRLTFEYDARQELVSYLVEDEFSHLSDLELESRLIGGTLNPVYPDDKDIFPDSFEINFRNEVPHVVRGKAIVPATIDPNAETITITTESFFVSSATSNSSEPVNIVPEIPVNRLQNFIGSFMLIGDHKYLVQNIIPTLPNGVNPTFVIVRSEISEALATNSIADLTELQQNANLVDGLFTVVENMQSPISWNQPFNDTISNPITSSIQVGLWTDQYWNIKREIINVNTEDESKKFLEKSRGFWWNSNQVLITKIDEEDEEIINPTDGTISYTYRHKGLYKINLDTPLMPHSQGIGEYNVEWYRGMVRLRTNSSMINKGLRTNYEVIRIAKDVNNGNKAILIVRDPNFPQDIESLSGYDGLSLQPQSLNFYPGYRLYFHAHQSVGLTELGTLPPDGEEEKFSIFGIRTAKYMDNQSTFYHSKYSVPSLMFAQEINEPQTPLPPLGANYATRPDFFGKSTYSFSTKFGTADTYKPHGVIFMRSNDEAILSALYSDTKRLVIKNELMLLGGNDEVYLQNRWNDFFDFDSYRVDDRAIIPTPPPLLYTKFPLGQTESYNFPLPDNPKFIAAINDFIKWHNDTNDSNTELINSIDKLNQVIIADSYTPVFAIDFIQQTIQNTFVPLTEMPIIFKYINFDEPTNKKQNIKDKNGNLLSTQSPDFSMAPMAKRVDSTTNEVLFTDFTLDGTSKNVYFYSVREMSSSLQMSSFSDFMGPIKLINTNPPETPEVRNIIPVLENRVLNILPSIDFEINPYGKEYYIKKINLYRSFDRLKAQSVRTMDFVKEIDIETAGIEEDITWKIKDDFSNPGSIIPYGDPLFYRITVSRKVEYNDGDNVINEYAPSLPSKILATTIMDSYSPESPVISYHSEPLINGETELNYITLNWNETAYKGNYHLYKMNSQGNWVEIARILSDRFENGVYHIFNTNNLNNANPTNSWIESSITNSVNNTIYLQLEVTNINDSSLTVLSEDGSKLYHHFKVIAENTSGMLSSKENILTIYNEVTWTAIGGIAPEDRSVGMIVGHTFIITEN